MRFKVLRLAVIGFVVAMWAFSGASSVPRAFASEPTNDDPANPAVVTNALPFHAVQDTTEACVGGANCDPTWLDNNNDPGATAFDNTGASCLPAGAHYSSAVWYEWTATYTGDVHVDTLGSQDYNGGSNPQPAGTTGSPYDVMQAAYAGPVTSASTPVANSCNDDTVVGKPYTDSGATFAVTQGTVYYLMFATFNASGVASAGPAGYLHVNIEQADQSFNPSNLPNQSVNAIEGQAMPNVLIGSFQDNDGTGAANAAADAANYSVNIDWGDGGPATNGITTSSTLDANIQCNEDAGGTITCNIYSSHIYGEESTTPDSLGITVNDNRGGDTTGTVLDQYAAVVVADAPLSCIGTLCNKSLAAGTITEGVPFTNVVLGTFRDAAYTPPPPNTTPTSNACDTAPGDYSASVQWGDGTTDTSPTHVTIVSAGDGNPCDFNVEGSHTYPNPAPAGGYHLTINVLDNGDTAPNSGGSQVTWTVDAAVADAALGLTTFRGPWGTNCGAIANNGDCVKEGFPISMTGPAAQQGKPIVLAVFNDAGNAGLPGDCANVINGFTATIGWGDDASNPDHSISTATAANQGIVPASSIAALGDPNPCDFAIQGDHTYLHDGTFYLTITVTDAGGFVTPPLVGTAGNGGSVLVTAPLSPVLQNQVIQATEGAGVHNVKLGTFHDSAGASSCSASDYTATINWDTAAAGQTTTATYNNGGIVPSNDNVPCDFDVFGTYAAPGTQSYAYNKQGSYNIQVTIQDEDADQTTLADQAQVADATLTPGQLAQTYNVTEGITDGTAASPRYLGVVTDADPNCSPNNLNVSINWGDGTPLDTTTGALSQPGAVADLNGLATPNPGSCTYAVTASHAFLEETIPGEPFQVHVVVTDNNGDPTITTGQVANIFDTAKAYDAQLFKDLVSPAGACGTVLCQTETAGVGFKNLVIGSFYDTTVPGVCDINDYSATVNWGDSSVNPGANNTTLTYANGGIVPAPSTRSDKAVGAVAVAREYNGQVTGISVLNPGLMYSNPPAITLVGGGGTGATAMATVANGMVTGIIVTSPGSGYASVPAVQISGVPSTCDFSLLGSYKYMTEGSYNISINVTDKGGASLGTPVFDQVTVGDSPISTAANPITPSNFTGVEGIGTNAATATATVVGGTITGLTLNGGGTGYTTPPAVTFSSPTGSGATATTTLDAGGHVKAINLGAGGSGYDPLTTQVLIAPPPQLIATFTDSDPLCSVSSFQAPGGGVTWINWGDGSGSDTSTGFVQQISGCKFGVYGSHVYPEAGQFKVDTLVADAGGATAQLSTSPDANCTPDCSTIATISDAALSQVGPNVSLPGAGPSVLEGKGFNNQVIGTFTDADPNCGPASDPSASDYTAAVNWGDGTTNDVSGGGNVTIQRVDPTNTPCPAQTFQILGSHTYSEEKATSQAAATATLGSGLTAGQVTGLSLTDPGSGYTTAPAVTFSSPSGGSGATAKTTLNAAGQVATITILTPGSGYLIPPTVNIAPPPQLAAGIAAIDLTGKVTGVTMTNFGKGYDPNHPPTVTFSTPGGGGTSAQGKANVSPDGTIHTITITNPGSGYKHLPVVLIAPPPALYNVDITVTDNDNGAQSKVPYISTLPLVATISVIDAPLTALSNVSVQNCTLLTACDTQHNTTDPAQISTLPLGQDPVPGAAHPIAIFSDPVMNNSTFACDMEAGPVAGTFETIPYHYRVAINWGDGSPIDTTSGVVTEPDPIGNPCVYDVFGTHTYVAPGTYVPTATITDEGGSSITTCNSTPLAPATPAACGAGATDDTAPVINVIVPNTTPHTAHTPASISTTYSKTVTGGTYKLLLSVSQYNTPPPNGQGLYLGSLAFADPALHIATPTCTATKLPGACHLYIDSFDAILDGHGPITKTGLVFGHYVYAVGGKTITRYFRVDVTDPDPSYADTFTFTTGLFDSVTGAPNGAVASTPPTAATNATKVVPS